MGLFSDNRGILFGGVKSSWKVLKCDCILFRVSSSLWMHRKGTIILYCPRQQAKSSYCVASTSGGVMVWFALHNRIPPFFVTAVSAKLNNTSSTAV